ncbi:MAG: hypothetical protein IKD42_01030 [Kiritimatiellae bacterium]|nr:hypothetical protein [Kiritimatiellia bacterium]
MKCNERSEAARTGTDADLYRKTHAVTAKKKTSTSRIEGRNRPEQKKGMFKNNKNAAIPSKHEDCGDSVFIGNGRSGGI